MTDREILAAIFRTEPMKVYDLGSNRFATGRELLTAIEQAQNTEAAPEVEGDPFPGAEDFSLWKGENGWMWNLSFPLKPEMGGEAPTRSVALAAMRETCK
jgi:hypothetical protein